MLWMYLLRLDVRGELKCYQQDCEAAMLEDSGKHYSRLASGWIVEDSCPDYMVKVEKCLKSERETVARYVHSSTEHKLVARIKHELLVVYKAQLLEKEDSGFRALIWNDKVEDLSRMFNLYIEIPEGLEFAANIFEQHITSEGTMLVQKVEDASSSLVANIIRLHDRYMEYVDGCFKNHAFFHRALREAFEELCNKDVAGTSFAELLLMFCDDMLKKGGACEKLSDETIEENLENALKLLVYVSDRDLFTKFYKKTLSRRLLFGKSASQENKDLILTKLKQQFGAQFTSKMEAMVIDIKLSKESQKNFKKYLQDNHPDVNTLEIDLNVTVLTTTSWPNFKSTLFRNAYF